MTASGPAPPTIEVFSAGTVEGSVPDGCSIRPCADVRSALEAARDHEGLSVVVMGSVVLPPAFLEQVQRAVSDPGLDDCRWAMLVSDGRTLEGEHVDGASSYGSFAAPAHRALRGFASGSPTVAVVNGPEIAAAGIEMAERFEEAARQLWLAGWSTLISAWLGHWRMAPSDPALDDRVRFDLRARLRSTRPDPSLAVVVRSTLERPALLDRTMRSLARASLRRSIDDVVIVTDRDAGRLQAVVADARSAHPALPVRGVTVGPSPVPSRTATLLAGIRAVDTDYVWVVDDDDAVLERSVEAIKDTVASRDRPVVVGCAVEVAEEWASDDVSPMASRVLGRFEAAAWPAAFAGSNPIPNCSAVLPVDVARRRVDEIVLRHDFGEDYALLLAVLTAPGLDVVTVGETLARISIRGDGTNVTTGQGDAAWAGSIAGFLADLTADRAASSPVPWVLASSSTPGADRGTAGESEPRWRTVAKRLLPGRLQRIVRGFLNRGRGRTHLEPGALAEAVRNAVVLMPAVPYHVEEVEPLAEELARRGERPVYVISDERWSAVRPKLGDSSFEVLRCPPAGPWIADARAVVVFNDWSEIYRDVVVTARSFGVPTFGRVEGVQDFDDADVGWPRMAYRTVDIVLGQGQNDVDALSGQRVEIVGSHRLEAMWRRPVRGRPAELAVINVNFTYGVLEEARAGWVADAVQACKDAGVAFVVSQHHADESDLAGLPVSKEPIGALLDRATVLISRFSTVPFEAMARGVPWVYFNPHGERVPTFSEPNRAFSVARSRADLRGHLDATRSIADPRNRSEGYFRAQVSIDPEGTATRRSVDAVVGELEPGT